MLSLHERSRVDAIEREQALIQEAARREQEAARRDELAHFEKQKMRDEAKAREQAALAREQAALAEKQKMREEAKEREELVFREKEQLRLEACKREENLLRAKADAEQANLMREQSYMQAELKRKEIETAAATELQKQQIEANLKRQAMERQEMERELHTRMEFGKQLAAEKQEILRLQYEAKTRSLEQQLKDKAQLLFTTTQESVQTRVATPACATLESSSCATSWSPGFTQSLFQGPPPLFASSLLSSLSQPLPILALSTAVQPTPAPMPSVFGAQPAFSYGAPHVTQPIVATYCLALVTVVLKSSVRA